MASRPAGSTPLGARDASRRRGGMLRWLLLALLAAIIVVALIALLSGGDDDKGSTSASASLKAGGAALLPASAGSLKPAIGQQATGSGLKVVSVNAGKGFFVGTSPQNRIYVEFGGDVGKNETGSLPAKGDAVSIKGVVQAAPKDPAKTLKLEPDDAALVKREGGFLNASSVR